MKRITKLVPDAVYDKMVALAEFVIGYEIEVDDGNGGLKPNPQSKELWFESIYNGMCQNGHNHMKKVKRNMELGEVVEDEL